MKPVLRFTPYAWSKMCYMRDKESGLEVGAFGLSDLNDVLLVRDIVLPKQEVSGAFVEFLELPAFYEDMVDLGWNLQQFSRIWIHTHPFDSATPSNTDESTFAEVFGGNDWGLMFILAKTGKTTCRLQINRGQLNGQFDIDWRVTYNVDFPGTNREQWAKEYADNVTKRTYTTVNQNWQGYGSYNGYTQGTNYQTGFRTSGGGMHQKDDDAFPRERALVERTSKKNAAIGFRRGDDDDKEFEEHNNFQKLQVEEDDPRGPFGLGNDIPWLIG